MSAGAGTVHDDRAARAVRRALIREHHPDRGGDVDTFVRLLDRLDAAHAAAGDPARTLGRSRRLRVRRLRCLARAARTALPRRLPGARRYASY